MFRRVVRPVLVLALVLAIVKGLVSWLEPRLTFFPSRGETHTPASLGLQHQTLSIPTSDGERLTAWWMPHEAARADILYFHGNGGNLSLWLPILAGVHAQGLNVLAVDYRGYGLSTGTPSEQGVYRDAKAVLLAYRRLRSPGRPTVYWGRSLGGPVAAYATMVERPDGLILESTFPDKVAVIRANPVLRALNVFAAYRFATLEMLRGFDRPALVIHGEADTIVPFAAGRALYESLQGPRQFLAIPSADHNDLQPASAAAYWGAIDKLIEQSSRR